jgi:hypothetical protein
MSGCRVQGRRSRIACDATAGSALDAVAASRTMGPPRKTAPQHTEHAFPMIRSGLRACCWHGPACGGRGLPKAGGRRRRRARRRAAAPLVAALATLRKRQLDESAAAGVAYRSGLAGLD